MPTDVTTEHDSYHMYSIQMSEREEDLDSAR